jgi:hypothetical protein
MAKLSPSSRLSEWHWERGHRYRQGVYEGIESIQAARRMVTPAVGEDQVV